VVLGVPLGQLLRAAAFPLFATVAAGGIFSVLIITTVLLVGLVMRVLAWQRFTFAFDGEVLRVEEGVLSRSARSLDVARVQQVEIDRGPVQRLLGLAALRVETAGSSAEVEVELRVVTEDEAVALRDAIREGKARATGATATPATATAASPTGSTGDDAGDGSTPTGEPDRRELLRVPLPHVALAAVTGGRLLVFPAVIIGALQFAGDLFGGLFDNLLERFLTNGTAGMPSWRDLTLRTGLAATAGVLVLAVVAAVVVGVLQDANYRVRRIEDDLHVRRGLLSTRDSVVPLRRVQLVEIHRNWLRRLLGFATVRIHSAGGSADGDRRVTVPLLPDGRIDAFLREVLPGVAGVPDLVAHPPQARRRVVFRWLRPPLVLVAIAWAWDGVPFTPFDLPDPVRFGVLVLLPLAVLLGVVEHRNLGHALTERVVVSRRGALSITTGLAPVVKVQAAGRSANWFQRRLGLTTVHAHVAGPGGDLEVLDAGTDDGARLYAALVQHAADPDPVGPAAEDEAVPAAT